MKIKRIDGDFAQAEAGGLLRAVNIQMLSSPCPGDYILVHAGFAIEKVDPEKAGQALRLICGPRPPGRAGHSAGKGRTG